MQIIVAIAAAMGVMSGIGFTMMGMDKQCARRQRRRIPEKRLWIVSWLLGAAGAAIGMRVFHHKTRHTKFRIGLPVLALIQAAGLAVAIYWVYL